MTKRKIIDIAFIAYIFLLWIMAGITPAASAENLVIPGLINPGAATSQANGPAIDLPDPVPAKKAAAPAPSHFCLRSETGQPKPCDGVAPGTTDPKTGQ